MTTRLFLRYVPQAGSARRYYDRETGHTISRRSFLRLLGIHPEQRALARRAAGLIPRRKRRCDAGVIRSVLVWAKARTVKYVGRFAQVVPYSERHPVALAQRFAVVIDHVIAAQVHLLPGQNNHCAVWRCACGKKLQNKDDLVGHVAILHLHGMGASSIPFPGEVHPNERRARLPWRVSSDDPRYQ